MKNVKNLFATVSFLSVLAAALSVAPAHAETPDSALVTKGAVLTALADKQNKLNSGDGGNVSEDGTGNTVAAITASNGTVTVKKQNVQIPVGSATATSYASIWVN